MLNEVENDEANTMGARIKLKKLYISTLLTVSDLKNHFNKCKLFIKTVSHLKNDKH